MTTRLWPMKYTTKKPTEPGNYMINGAARVVYLGTETGHLYYYDSQCDVRYIHQHYELGTQYCPIPEPEPLDKFEEWWGNNNDQYEYYAKDTLREVFKAGREAGE